MISGDNHFFLIAADADDHDSLVENGVDYVTPVLQAVIDHDLFALPENTAVTTNYQERRRFLLAKRLGHFNDGFDAVVVDANRLPRRLAGDDVAKVEITQIFVRFGNGRRFAFLGGGGLYRPPFADGVLDIEEFDARHILRAVRPQANVIRPPVRRDHHRRLKADLLRANENMRHIAAGNSRLHLPAHAVAQIDAGDAFPAFQLNVGNLHDRAHHRWLFRAEQKFD